MNLKRASAMSTCLMAVRNKKGDENENVNVLKEIFLALWRTSTVEERHFVSRISADLDRNDFATEKNATSPFTMNFFLEMPSSCIITALDNLEKYPDVADPISRNILRSRGYKQLGLDQVAAAFETKAEVMARQPKSLRLWLSRLT